MPPLTSLESASPNIRWLPLSEEPHIAPPAATMSSLAKTGRVCV